MTMLVRQCAGRKYLTSAMPRTAAAAAGGRRPAAAQRLGIWEALSEKREKVKRRLCGRNCLVAPRGVAG